MSPRSYASVVAFQKGMQIIVKKTIIMLMYLYAIWYGVTISGLKNLAIRMFADRNCIMAAICNQKNFNPMLPSSKADCRFIPLIVGLS